MIRRHRHLYGLFIGALLFAACSPGSPVAPTEGPTAPPPLAGPTLAPTAAPSLQDYSNPDFGFSFSYPAGYELQSSFPHSVVFLAPQDTSGHRERGWLAVELASEDNAEWYADQAKAENANFGIEITSSTQVIDGQQAYVLGGLPGQDLNRQVIVVYNGILYRFTFVPDDPAAGEAYEQMEALYAAIVNSLRFLPEHQAVPPVTDIGNMMHHLERALNARSAEGIARLMGDGFALGSLSSTTAEGFTYQTFGRTDAVPLILNQLSLAPAVSLQYQVDWTSVPGSLDTYSGIFPGEDVTPILAKGWGPGGADQAVIIIARRIDSSLLWRGVFVLQQQ